MTATTNLRKAALLIRSLDADAASGLLAQLSAEEAADLRAAMRALGPIDSEEQADLVAEFRRARPLAGQPAHEGVELMLAQAPLERNAPRVVEPPLSRSGAKRFEFLENAPTSVLVAHLSREHAQTIAVVLTHLAPAHAAEVLADLPARIRSEAIARLSTLGDTDSESLAVLESELAAWATQRIGGRADRGRRREAMAAILDAADAKSRTAILETLDAYKFSDAARSPMQSHPEQSIVKTSNPARSSFAQSARNLEARQRATKPVHDASAGMQPPQGPAPIRPPVPQLDFDQLIHLDDRSLAAVLHAVDANALALALAGSSDELVDRICGQMPTRVAKSFRRELRRLGPTRLSDVETAQRFVARTAAEQLASRRTNPVRHSA